MLGEGQIDVASAKSPNEANAKNTGVGSLSFLQRTFPIQELNLGLLHCRRILC